MKRSKSGILGGGTNAAHCAPPGVDHIRRDAKIFVDYHSRLAYESRIPLDGASPATILRRSGRGVPANCGPGGSAQPPARADALGGEALAAVPAAMPESERAGASRAQNRHGGAPRGERTDRKVRAAPEQRGNYKDYAPVGAPPSPWGWQQDEGCPRRRKRRGKNGVVPGHIGTGLFDIVNRGSAASRRLRSRSRGDAPSCVVVSNTRDCRPRVGGDPVFHRSACVARWVPAYAGTTAGREWA
jgi:hypothetical protein